MWQSASWVPFSVIKFWKLKAFSVFKGTLHAATFAMQVIIHPDWPILNWQPMRAGVLAERIKTSCVWHLIRNIATFNRANDHNDNAISPQLFNFEKELIPVSCCALLLLMIRLLLKIIDCGLIIDYC